MDTIHIGPWRGYDPRDDDWQCSYCNSQCPNGPRECSGCHRPRLLNQEEKTHIQKSENSGQELCRKVMSGEFRKSHPDRNLDEMIEGFRQWYRIPCQVITIREKHYILVAARSDEEEDTVKFFFKDNWREEKEHTFPEPKPLNIITKEICDIILKNDQ